MKINFIKDFLRRRAILKNANYLTLTPVRLAEEEIDEEGSKVAILMPRFVSAFANKYFLPKRKSTHTKINLDQLSGITWLLIDGEKNVEEIAQELHEKCSDKITSITDAEQRLTKFLTFLYTQKLITFRELQ